MMRHNPLLLSLLLALLLVGLVQAQKQMLPSLNVGGIIIHAETADEYCPNEWMGMLTCVLRVCIKFSEVCPSSTIATTTTTEERVSNATKVPSCDEIDDNMCSFFDEHSDCCLQDCLEELYDVHNCLIEETLTTKDEDVGNCTVPTCSQPINDGEGDEEASTQSAPDNPSPPTPFTTNNSPTPSTTNNPPTPTPLSDNSPTPSANNNPPPPPPTTNNNNPPSSTPLTTTTTNADQTCTLTLNANPTVCSTLLSTTQANCDCYNFCDDQLITCLGFGERTSFSCPGNLVAGCTQDME